MNAFEAVDGIDRAVGARLAACRTDRRLTEERVADLAEITVEELRAIERGTAKVYASTLCLISAALGTRVSDLLSRLPN